MSAFKLHTLKQKLWAIVATSFIARLLMFFALPNTPTSLAPDEGTYRALASWIAESKPATDFPGFGEGLYLSGRSLVIPASTLVKFGMNDLDAVRLTSSVYGFLALCAAVYLVTRLLQPSNAGVTLNKKIESLVVTLLMVYAFLPSHFVWSNLGLRESPNEFWLIMTFTGVFLLYKEGQQKKLLLAVLVSISIVCTFGSRPQVGWVLVVTLLIYSIFKLRNKLTYLLITSVLTGLFAGYLTTTSFAYVTSDLYVAKDATPTPTKDATPTPTKDATPTPTKDSTPTPTKDSTPTPTKDSTPTPTKDATPTPTKDSTPTPTKDATPTPTKDSTPTPTKDSTPTPTKDATPTPTKDATPTPTKDSTPTPTNSGEVNASKLCDGTKLKVEYKGKSYDCVKSGTVTKRERPSNLAEVAIDQVEVIPGKQIVNQIGAASMIERLTCPWDESSEIGKYGCLAFRAPYMTLTFLFRPLPFIDTTSLASMFAAAENTLWIFMIAFIVYRISKVKRIPFVNEIGPAVIFCSLYVVGAGSYEGNMGTAFRHKSLILWVVLLLVFVTSKTFSQRESQKPEITS
jgi:hypothetical protein